MSTKLSPEAVAEIREGRQRQKTLAEKFGVSPSTISRVQRSGFSKNNDLDDEDMLDIAAENEQLKNIISGQSDAAIRLHDAIDALRAENEQLRAALAGYADGCHACGGDPVIDRRDMVPPIYICRECQPARAALGRDKRAYGDQT